MPRRSKASNAAHAKRKQSNNQFTRTSPEFSDTGSLYNDPGDDNSGDESSVERWEAEREAPIAKEKPRRALYGKTNELRTGIGMFYTRKETPRDLWHR